MLDSETASCVFIDPMKKHTVGALGIAVCIGLFAAGCDDSEKQELKAKVFALQNEQAKQKEEAEKERAERLQATLEQQSVHLGQILEIVQSASKETAEARKGLTSANAEVARLKELVTSIATNLDSLKAQMATADKAAIAQRLGEFTDKIREVLATPPPPPPPPPPSESDGSDSKDDAIKKALANAVQIGMQALCGVYPQFCPLFEALAQIFSAALTSPDHSAGNITEVKNGEQTLRNVNQKLQEMNDVQRKALSEVLKIIPKKYWDQFSLPTELKDELDHARKGEPVPPTKSVPNTN
jgi:hypothetical protein